MLTVSRSKSPSRDGYHHGNLRAALLDAGLALVAERGVDGFTLRELSRRAGVSHAAPYHHFADRSALVRALIAESYEELGRALAAAAEGEGADPVERIAAMGTGYVRFALANPERYRLMFRANLATSPDGGDDSADRAGAQAFAVLVSACEEAARSGRFADGVDAGTAAAACWSTVHGVASLLLDGALGVPSNQEERALHLARRVVDVTLLGLAAAAPS
jgi:AcrR family transcriptional regulator